MSDPNKPQLEEIAFKDLPHHLALKFITFGVTMIGIDRPAQYVRHQGSGTFVQSAGRYYILTAAHCAESLQECKELGLAISNKPDSTTHLIPKPIYIGDYGSYGPDLAFLPLDDKTVQFILSNSNKVFYDLDRNRDAILNAAPKISNGLWVAVGAPKQLCDLKEPRSLMINIMAYSVGLNEPYVMNDFDYIDVRIALDKPDVLDYYSGISGGGLWQVDIGRHQDGTFVFTGEPNLEGTVFLELLPQQGAYKFFRCHSRNSIYRRGIDELARC